jgi:hypothetical protein
MVSYQSEKEDGQKQRQKKRSKYHSPDAVRGHIDMHIRIRNVHIEGRERGKKHAMQIIKNILHGTVTSSVV